MTIINSYDIKSLEKLFEQHQKLTFPEPTANEELYDIKAELALYDGHVAGLVSSFLQNAPVNSNFVSLDENLIEHMQKFKPKTKEEEKSIKELVKYRKSLDLLITNLSKLINK